MTPYAAGERREVEHDRLQRQQQRPERPGQQHERRQRDQPSISGKLP